MIPMTITMPRTAPRVSAIRDSGAGGADGSRGAGGSNFGGTDGSAWGESEGEEGEETLVPLSDFEGFEGVSSAFPSARYTCSLSSGRVSGTIFAEGGGPDTRQTVGGWPASTR